MRKYKILLLFFVLVNGVAKAQFYQERSRTTVGIGLELEIPTTIGFKDWHYPGVAGSLRLGYQLNDYFDFVAVGTLARFLQKDSNTDSAYYSPSITLTGLSGGVRFHMAEVMDEGFFYLQPQVGVSAIGIRKPRFSGSYSIGAGYVIDERFDVSLRYQGLLGKNKLEFIGVGLAYQLNL